ncbi:MAG TPA: ABC transporter substrate-binding protein [Candidatus Baltobacteraceae bacterium]|nr:ABC transporter substrate-binding protein [Candidatus Baltobacteraceae bacterium]
MNGRVRRRDVLKGMGGIAVGAAMSGLGRARRAEAQRRFDGETVRVQFWAGPEGQTIRSGVVEPFIQKTGTKVVVTEGWTSASIAKARAEKANPSTSVYLLDDYGAIAAGREGVFEPLDLSRIPNAADVDPRFVLENKLGIGFFTYVTGLVYNTNIVKTPPTSWKVLWDPQYKGKIAIPPVAAGPALHMAIVAAMVNGGNQHNMEPAWDALKALKPNVAVMEQSGAVLAELLRTGEVALVMRTVYLFKSYIEQGYPIGISLNMQEGFFATPGCAAITRNHPDKIDPIYAFVNETLSGDAQAKMAQLLWFGPTNRKVTIPPEVSKYLISTPEQWNKIIKVDQEDLAAHREEWIQKYTRALV